MDVIIPDVQKFVWRLGMTSQFKKVGVIPSNARNRFVAIPILVNYAFKGFNIVFLQNRSFQSGLKSLIRLIFLSLDIPLICFSLVIAISIFSYIS